MYNPRPNQPCVLSNDEGSNPYACQQFVINVCSRGFPSFGITLFSIKVQAYNIKAAIRAVRSNIKASKSQISLKLNEVVLLWDPKQ